MFEKIKARAQQARDFVQEHPTLVLVTVTAVASSVITRKSDIKAMSEVAHEWGEYAGRLKHYVSELELESLTFDEFLDAKGLSHAYQEFYKQANANVVSVV